MTLDHLTAASPNGRPHLPHPAPADTVRPTELMPSLQDQYDEALFDFSLGDYPGCIAKLEAILAADPDHFDARLALGMACCRNGDLQRAIAEGHRAEQLRPDDQLVHTNLSLFYVKAGNVAAAEHHGMRSKMAALTEEAATPSPAPGADSTASETGKTSLNLAATPPPEPVRFTARKSDPPAPSPKPDDEA